MFLLEVLKASSYAHYLCVCITHAYLCVGMYTYREINSFSTLAIHQPSPLPAQQSHTAFSFPHVTRAGLFRNYSFGGSP